jgi:hypothetical protein
MPTQRTPNSAMLYFGMVALVLLLAGCGGSEPTEQQSLAKMQHEADAIQAAVIARQAKTPKPDPPPRPRPKPKPPRSEHLMSEGWKQLGKELYFTLEIGGGARMLTALHTEAEQNCHAEEAPCYHEIGSKLVQRMMQARSVVKDLESTVEPGLCREGLEQVYRTFDAPLLRAQEFEAGHASEFLWEETERELEGPLTIERGEEGHPQLTVQSVPLASCDPSGTGKIVLGTPGGSEEGSG